LTTLSATGATNGNLTVTTDTGLLRTVPFAQISAIGNLTLQNLDALSGGAASPNGLLIIGTGSSIEAGGNVTLAVDSNSTITATTAVHTGDVSNLTVNGNVFTNAASPTGCIGALPPTNTATTTTGTSVKFDIESTNANGANAIQLEGGVNISAGTPVGYTEASHPDEMIVDSGLDAE
jgi:hypothetical protein